MTTVWVSPGATSFACLCEHPSERQSEKLCHKFVPKSLNSHRLTGAVGVFNMLVDCQLIPVQCQSFLFHPTYSRNAT